MTIDQKDLDILHYLRQGKTAKEIAPIVCLSPHTVRHRIIKLIQETGVSNRVALVDYFWALGAFQ